MNYRALTVSAVLATGVVGFAPICHADIVASEGGIAVRDAGVAAPARGMTMAQVASKFGDPVTKVPAVGSPPISRWEYSGFVVYFERDHVIHAVVSESTPPGSSGSASAPAAAAPAPTSEPVPAAAPVEAPVAEAEAPVAEAPVARVEVPSAAPVAHAAPVATPATVTTAPVTTASAATPGASADSETPPQP